jgi:hypothetical protein
VIALFGVYCQYISYAVGAPNTLYFENILILKSMSKFFGNHARTKYEFQKILSACNKTLSEPVGRGWGFERNKKDQIVGWVTIWSLSLFIRGVLVSSRLGAWEKQNKLERHKLYFIFSNQLWQNKVLNYKLL